MPVRLATILIAVLIAAASPACRAREAPAAATRQRRADRSIVLSPASARYVRVELARPASSEQLRTFPAQVAYDERRLAKLGPPVSGRVGSVKVVPGDQVKSGSILLTLQAPDIAGAQAQVAQAKSARATAERTAERTALLVKEGAGSEAEHQRSEAALEQARNEEQRAIAAMNAIGGANGANGFDLKTPIAGTIVERNVTVGTQVHADQDQPLIVVADLSTVWVQADVYEQDLKDVHVGDDVTVEILAQSDKRFPAKINYVGEVVDPQTRAVRARIELDNSERALRPGMFARVEVRGTSTATAEVPTSALVARRDQFYVFTQNADGAFTEREVRLGRQHGEHTTILGGLSPGDHVVTEGAVLLDAEANEAL